MNIKTVLIADNCKSSSTNVIYKHTAKKHRAGSGGSYIRSPRIQRVIYSIRVGSF